MDFTWSVLLYRGSEVNLELKILIFHVVHFYHGGLSLFWSSKYGFICRALLSSGSECILELKIWILLVVCFYIGGLRSSLIELLLV